MSEYYKGQRRFALGGKGWTAVLGCVVSLSYVRRPFRGFERPFGALFGS